VRILVSTSARNVPSARKALVEKKTKLEAELAEINKQLRDLAGNDAEAAEAAAVKLVKSAGLKLRKYDSGNYEIQVGLKKSVKNAFGGIWLSVNNQGKISISLLRTVIQVRNPGSSSAKSFSDTVVAKTVKPASTVAAITKAVETLTTAAQKLVEVAPKTVNTNLRSTPPGGRRK
jgi:uncharacterized protein (UPF0335 family)